ncbi:MAG: MBL fold metallo-hydrolase [Kordiimonadaceae bacterium]|nr:MBL fold metallo-hydrolase [Kordiimonadaceae bacterium]
MAIGQQVDYLTTPTNQSAKLDQISEKVWTFGWYFDRTLIVDTDDGLVIVDPFSKDFISRLLPALKAAGLDKPIHSLIYTHYHLDHTRGGAALNPQNVICHVKCESYWDKFEPEETADIVRPTKTIDGDQKFEIGGVKFELVHLGLAHTDTNYAVFLPDDKTVFLADTVAIEALLPAGGVSIFMPEYLTALNTIQELDFTTFVSSHFTWGNKQDYIDAAELQRDGRKWVIEAIAHVGGSSNQPIPLINDKERFVEAFDYFYVKMAAKYGDWHGFDAQILPTFLNGFIAYHVGS